MSRSGALRTIRVLSAVGLVIAAVAAVRVLPMNEMAAALRGWLDGLGVAGPLVLGGLYVLATVLMLPGVPLTLVAGAVFGVGIGFVTVSISSTIGAALAFLIARSIARGKVERMVKANPRLGAFDDAVRDGGWRVVALLRLSPAVPFNVQNYLYGVTPIGFRTCVLTSWIAMLPGTLLYVYLGHVAGVAAGTEARERTTAEWFALVLGLAATVVVTMYLTRLARRRLALRTDLEPADARGPSVDAAPRTGRTILLAALALGALGAAAALHLNRDAVRTAITARFGPPAVVLREAHGQEPGTASFDHAAFDRLLRKHVDAAGSVDYATLARDPSELDAYIRSLATAPLEELGRDERLALLINGYNACTIRLILDHWPLESIKSIPASKRWDAKHWTIGGRTWSLEQIEHEQIRPKFREPRIHFALVCAAVGCPPLRPEAYVASRLDAQLEAQTQLVHGRERWFRFDAEKGVVHLTKLYDWYGGDFEQVSEPKTVLAYASRYAPPLRAALDAGRPPRVRWLDYDWALNGPVGPGRAE